MFSFHSCSGLFFLMHDFFLHLLTLVSYRCCFMLLHIFSEILMTKFSSVRLVVCIVLYLSSTLIFIIILQHILLCKYIICFCVAAHSSFCGSMNVKGLVTEDASHLNLNGSLCKYPQKGFFYS